MGDISNLSHDIIQRYCNNFNVAVDATLGNGYDTDFLSSIFKEVKCFEIQHNAIEAYSKRKKDNVLLLNVSHENLNDYCEDNIDCIVYNLGYLPGGDKNITTLVESTITSLKQATKLLKPGGLISIAIYTGHDEGKLEKEALIKFAKELPKNEFGVMLHTLLNRKNIAPELLVIEKNRK